MAAQAAGTVATAVISGVTDRALTTVVRKLRSGSRQRQAATDEKLQRLETLVLKLRCAVEASEKHALRIRSASLLEWRDRLREAAAEGGAVVLDFQRRAREAEEEEGSEAAAATSASASASAPGQQRPAGGALYFTRCALSGVAQRVRDATRRLFSADEDVQKLDGALEKMERLSPDVTQFLLTLQLEVSPKLDRRRAKRRAPASAPADDRVLEKKPSSMAWSSAAEVPSRERSNVPRMVPIESAQILWSWKAAASSEMARLASLALAPWEWETETEARARILAGELEATLRRMDGYYIVKVTDDTDMEGLEWLPEWAAVLREAAERGDAVLRTLCPGSDDGALEEEDGELYSFARAVERLARYDPCFDVLVNLCPWKLDTASPSEI